MEENYKALIIISLVIVVLFIGGFTYIYQQSKNRSVALDLVRQYLNTKDINSKQLLAGQIKSKIEKPPLALTSRASFDSFEVLIDTAQKCDQYAKSKTFNPRNEDSTDFEQLWRSCMDNPSVVK